MNPREPFNILKWIDQHKASFLPPICAKELWKDGDLQVFCVGGPNQRTDFHRNPREEMFYQLKGDMLLKTLEEGPKGWKPKDIHIREGEIFNLSPMIPHSPQRFSDTLGFVQEVRRSKDELDEMFWICEECRSVTYSEKFHNYDNEICLPKVVNHYYSDVQNRTCKKCGWVAPDKSK